MMGRVRPCGLKGGVWSLVLAVNVGPVACVSHGQHSLDTASLRLAQGDVAAAESILHTAANRMAQTLGPDCNETDFDIQQEATFRLAQLHASATEAPEAALKDWQVYAHRAKARSLPKSHGRAPVHFAKYNAQIVTAERQQADLLMGRLGRPQEAKGLLAALIERLGAREEATEVRFVLAQLLFRDQQYALAQAQAENLTARWPNDPWANKASLLVGRALHAQGHYKLAAHAFEALLDQRPAPKLVAVARSQVADCYQELGDSARALENYYAALGDHPMPALVQGRIVGLKQRLWDLHPSGRRINVARAHLGSSGQRGKTPHLP